MVWREQYRLQIRELTEEEPDSSRIPHFERELQNLEHLRAFALPLVETISEWPDEATWGDWLQRLEGFAPRILRKPEHVLRVLADLRPMAAIGPVSLLEVRDVLAGSAVVARGGAARESIRTRLRRQPASGAGPCVQGRLRARSGRADVPAEAARGSAAAGRSAAGSRRARAFLLQVAIGPRSSAFSCASRSALRLTGSTRRFRASNHPKPARACRRFTRSRSCARSPAGSQTIRRSSSRQRRSRTRTSHGRLRPMRRMR